MNLKKPGISPPAVGMTMVEKIIDFLLMLVKAIPGIKAIIKIRKKNEIRKKRDRKKKKIDRAVSKEDPDDINLITVDIISEHDTDDNDDSL